MTRNPGTAPEPMTPPAPRRRRAALPVAAAALVLGLTASSGAEDATSPEGACTRAVAETVYVPAFSRIHTHERQRQPLASTLVIHNVDPEASIEVTRVSYHDETGAQVSELGGDDNGPLPPFASLSYLTELTDDRGGIGANYIVDWRSERAACSPLILAIMIGGSGTQGISFSLEGRVIARRTSKAE